MRFASATPGMTIRRLASICGPKNEDRFNMSRAGTLTDRKSARIEQRPGDRVQVGTAAGSSSASPWFAPWR